MNSSDFQTGGSLSKGEEALPGQEKMQGKWSSNDQKHSEDKHISRKCP